MMMMMMMMKKIIPLLFIFLSILSCERSEKTVGLLSYNLNDPYIDFYARQIEGYARSNFSIISLNGENSQIIQNEQIESLISQNADLLIINPVDRLGAFAIIRKLKKKNIPAIFFNREPLQEDLSLWEKTYYVGAKAEQSGQLQAELVMDLFGGSPEELNQFDRNGDNRIQAIILKGEQGHQDAETRTTEVVKSFYNRGFNLDLLLTEVANWSEAEAQEKMEQIIIENGDNIEVILSNNDAMANGAITYLKSIDWFVDTNKNGIIDSDDDKWIPIIGIDGIEKAVRNIEEGYLYGTVLNDSDGQARAISELAEALLKGSDLSDLTYPLENEKYIWVDYQVFSSSIQKEILEK